MTPQRLCEQLIRSRRPATRASLIERAARNPECVGLLLERARATFRALPLQALGVVEIAIEVTRLSRDGRALAQAFRIRAQALRVLGRHEEALEAFDGASEAARGAGDRLLSALVQIGRIDSLGWLGRDDEAIAFAQGLERELSAAGAETEVAKVLDNVGNIYCRRGQYGLAYDCFQRAGDVFARNGDIVSLAIARSNCAIALTHFNRHEEAIVLFEQARATFAENGAGVEAAKVDGNIAYLHQVSGRLPAALASYSRARQEFEALGLEVETAKTDAETGDVYRALNLYPEALECYARAVQTFERIPIQEEFALAEMGRGAALAATGRGDEALPALERAEAIFRRKKNHPQRAHARLLRAHLLRTRGRAEEAENEARASARAFASAELPAWAAEARLLLAEITLERGGDVARPLTAIAQTAKRYGHGWLEARAERALGQFYARRQARGDAERALRHFGAGVDALEQARTLVTPEEMHVAFLQNKLGVYEDVVRTLLQRGRPGDLTLALEYVERAKSRLLLERMQTALETRSATGGAAISPARAKLAELRAELSRGYHLALTLDSEEQQRRADTDVDALEELERAYRETMREIELAELSTETGAFSLTSVIPSLALQSALLPGETLIEFYIVKDALCAFVLTAEGMRVCTEFAGFDEIAYALRRLRYHLRKVGLLREYAQRHNAELHAGVQNALCRLYDLLLRPLEPFLAGNKVVIVPHGPLHGLPFHAFYDGDCYALDRWEFVYAPSAAVWHAGARRAYLRTGQKTPDTHWPALVMGIPGPGIERVAEEVEQVGELLPEARVLTGDEATLEAFHAHAPKARLLHLATHALFRADNPLFSGLRFADGWLLARDLYETVLDCDLATLSACGTGGAVVEPGDELFGLIRGFLSAGTRSLAASLWPADDEATAALMGCFYTHLSQGASRAGALRRAQQETRCAFPHPYHWAAFTLIGER